MSFTTPIKLKYIITMATNYDVGVTMGVAYQLQYLNIPLMSTSLTLASTTGMVTSAAPRPTRTITPPERVA